MRNIRLIWQDRLTSKVLCKLIKRRYPGFISMDGVGVSLRYDEEEFIQFQQAGQQAGVPDVLRHVVDNGLPDFPFN